MLRQLQQLALWTSLFRSCSSEPQLSPSKRNVLCFLTSVSGQWLFGGHAVSAIFGEWSLRIVESFVPGRFCRDGWFYVYIVQYAENLMSKVNLGHWMDKLPIIHPSNIPCGIESLNLYSCQFVINYVRYGRTLLSERTELDQICTFKSHRFRFLLLNCSLHTTSNRMGWQVPLHSFQRVMKPVASYMSNVLRNCSPSDIWRNKNVDG